jgi:hypothetical protein
VSTHSTDRPSAADIADFERGHQASVAEVAATLQAALAAGAREMPTAEAAKLLKRMIGESLDRLPADTSVAEMAGRFDGTVEALAGLAWRSFVTILDMPVAPRGEVH